jgi:hypothetical protein
LSTVGGSSSAPTNAPPSRTKASPVGVDEFTDAVIRAEGLDPLTLERALRKQVRDRVAQAVQVS